MAEFHLEDVILKRLEKNVSILKADDQEQALLKLLVELRESARKNSDLETFTKISEGLKNIGITMQEETHIVPKIEVDARL